MQEMEKITLKPERVEFVKRNVEAGRFNSANDAVEEAFESLEAKSAQPSLSEEDAYIALGAILDERMKEAMEGNNITIPDGNLSDFIEQRAKSRKNNV